MSEHRALIGVGTLAQLGDVLDSLGLDTVLLVARPGSLARSGAEAAVRSALRGRSIERYASFGSNPRMEDVQGGVEGMRRLLRPDAAGTGLLAVGGGSVLDMAKLIAYFSAQGTDKVATGASQGSEPCRWPIVAIPTTAGTGSEATHFATVYRGTVKHSVAHPSLRPRVAIIDPRLTFSMPREVAASTGLDALCQALESLWAVAGTPESRADARRAVELILPALEESVLHCTHDARCRVAEGAYLAGRAIDVSKTTAAHALSYGLTIRWGVPHGHAVALMLAPLVEVSLRWCALHPDHRACAAMERVVSVLGGPAAAPRRISAFMERFGLASSLREIGLNERGDLDWLARGVNEARLQNHPCPLSDADLRTVLDLAWRGSAVG